MNAKDFRKINVVVAALDINTTKVYLHSRQKDRHGKIPDVIGTANKSEVGGVFARVIANIDKTVKAISDAVDLAEKRRSM